MRATKARPRRLACLCLLPEIRPDCACRSRTHKQRAGGETCGAGPLRHRKRPRRCRGCLSSRPLLHVAARNAAAAEPEPRCHYTSRAARSQSGTQGSIISYCISAVPSSVSHPKPQSYNTSRGDSPGPQPGQRGGRKPAGRVPASCRPRSADDSRAPLMRWAGVRSAAGGS